MGKISYSMYLIHVPIFILLYSLLVKFTGVEVFYTRIYWFGVVIAVGISYLFYYAVEHQSLKLIKKFKEKIKPKTKNSLNHKFLIPLLAYMFLTFYFQPLLLYF
ncbi:MAG: hypothetical protein ACOX0V_00465 [Bacteroidales bacterium]